MTTFSALGSPAVRPTSKHTVNNL